MQKRNPLVSILTPYYNTEKYLNKYLDRIIKQTYDNIEIVFINDGSTDKTEELIKRGTKKLEKRGFRVIYKKKENGGLGSAINLGLKIMTGDFFCWLDCDNYYENTYIEKNVQNNSYKCPSPHFSVSEIKMREKQTGKIE